MSSIYSPQHPPNIPRTNLPQPPRILYTRYHYPLPARPHHLRHHLRLNNNLRLPTRHRTRPLLRRAHPRHRRLPRRRHHHLFHHRRVLRPPDRRSHQSGTLRHPRRLPRLVAAHAARHVHVRNPSVDRCTWARVCGAHAPPRHDSQRDDELDEREHDGESDVYYHCAHPRRGIIWLFGRDQEKEQWQCESAVEVCGL